jgi:hypothetical protein
MQVLEGASGNTVHSLRADLCMYWKSADFPSGNMMDTDNALDIATDKDTVMDTAMNMDMDNFQ